MRYLGQLTFAAHIRRIVLFVVFPCFLQELVDTSPLKGDLERERVSCSESTSAVFLVHTVRHFWYSLNIPVHSLLSEVSIPRRYSIHVVSAPSSASGKLLYGGLTFAVPLEEARIIAPGGWGGLVETQRHMVSTYSLTSLHSGPSEADIVELSRLCQAAGAELQGCS